MLFPFHEDGKEFIIYQYQPSKSTAWAFLAMFAIATFAHLLYIIPMRTWYFLPLLIGGVCEIGGYYGRVWSASEPKEFKAFVLQVLLIIAAPLFIAATIYMSLGRFIRALDAEHHAIMSSRWISKIYVTADVISFALQLAGTGMQASTSLRVAQIGNNIVIGGLVFHSVLFCFFPITAAIVHWRLNKDPTPVATKTKGDWAKHWWMLYACSLVILVRNIFRISEFAEGQQGYITTHEVFLYVFDGGLMLTVCVLLLGLYPGRLLEKAEFVSHMGDRMCSEGGTLLEVTGN